MFLVITHSENVVPDGGAAEIDMEVRVAVLHTHQAILLHLRSREGTGEGGEGRGQRRTRNERFMQQLVTHPCSKIAYCTQ